MKNRLAQVFQMEFEGYNRREIAAVTGISENTLNIYLAKNGKWRLEYDFWRVEILGEIEKEARLRIKKRINEALTVQEILLTQIKSNPREAGRAARDILDRAGMVSPRIRTKISVDDKAEKITRIFETRNRQA